MRNLLVAGLMIISVFPVEAQEKVDVGALPPAATAQDKPADLGFGLALGYTVPASGPVLGSTVSYQFSRVRLAGHLEWVRKGPDRNYTPVLEVDCDVYHDPRNCGATYYAGGIEALAIVGRIAAGPGLRWADSDIGGRGTEPYGTIWVHIPLPQITDENSHEGLLVRLSAGEVYRQMSIGLHLMAWW